METFRNVVLTVAGLCIIGKTAYELYQIYTMRRAGADVQAATEATGKALRLLGGKGTGVMEVR